jgi:signal transduction histidine kinase
VVDRRSDRMTRLERLIEVSRNLNANLDCEPYLKSIIEIASELTYSTETSILELAPEGDHLHYTASPWYRLDKLKPLSIPLDKSVDGWVFNHKQPLIIQDALHDTRVFREVDRVLEEATYSICVVPMLIKGEPIGVMEAVNKLGHTNYSEEDVFILETLAAQAAVAIQNQKLLDNAQASYRQLLELDRMKSDFIAISSHELRIPLGLILGHASLLQEEATGETRIQLDTIVRNAMHLKDIIEDLADVDNFQSGLGKIRHRRFAMDRMIKDVVSSYQEQAREHNVSLRVSATKADVVVDGDAHKIRIALGNLVKNALTFTDPGDRVLVTGEQIPGYVKVCVIDNGIGIPTKDIDRIFDRFFQVESHLTRRHGGMGLGLPIARGMIEMHKGKLTVESVEGKGSNFTFFLPMNTEQVSAAQRVFLS